MGLDGRDDISDDLIDDRGSRFGGLTKKLRIPLIALLIGLILGAFVMHYYGEPLLTDEKNTSQARLERTNEVLNKENDCLYSLLDSARDDVKQCGAVAIDRNQ